MKAVDISGINKAIQEITMEYYDDVVDATKQAVDDETKAAYKVLKDNAPVRTGRYKKTLKKKKSFENLVEKRNTLYPEVKKGGRHMEHLVERPHATRNGKRTRGKPHFAPAEKHVLDNLETKIANNVKKIK